MNSLLATLTRLGPTRLIIIMGITIGVTMALLMMSFRIGSPEKALLFSGLDLKEASVMTAKLDQMGVAYDLRGGGSAIFVPRKKVMEARMALAKDNLPSSGSMGYEIFDKSSTIGQTGFSQNMAQLRALQGELERTITTLDGVSAARVLLVLPQRTLFQRESSAPKASVVIRLQDNVIGASQTRAIRQLVASAVPGLKAGGVTVADESGRLLAKPQNDENGTDLGDGQRTMVEMAISKKIKSMLQPITGSDGVQVQVAAVLDMNRVTETSTVYDPEGRVIVSSDTTEETSDDVQNENAGGVSVGSNVPSAKKDTSDGPKTRAATSRNSEILNYGNSKTDRTVIRQAGAITRLSVAVVVDGSLRTDADGKQVYTPRSADEMSQIEALVKSAMGFDPARKDAVTVTNVRFSRPAPLGDVPPPSKFSFDKNDIMRGLELFILAVVSIALMIFIGKPLITGLGGGGPVLAGGALAAGNTDLPQLPGSVAAVDESGTPAILPAPTAGDDDNDSIDVARIQGQVKVSSVKKVAKIVDSHPDEAMSILRTWLHEE